MKKTILLMSLLLLSTLASATPVIFNLDKTTDKTIDKGIFYSNFLVFQVSTFPDRLLCRYSQERWTPFELMLNFDSDFEIIHKKTLTGLSDGVHRYFVRCRDLFDRNNISTETRELEAIFTITNPISAEIILSDPILKAGKHEITLQTTKLPISAPQLKYSYDGITYNPVVLHGQDNLWKGFLVIPSTLGEEIGSFKFSAQDLEGRAGSQITGDNVFIVDTRSPPLITSLEASGEYGQIKLEWFLDDVEEIEEIKIYKSDSPNVDLTSLYKTLDGSSGDYIDTEVKNGKTYYYRISSLDAAGNAADLSREIYATSLLAETPTTSTGLSPSLVGSVDAFLSEIKFLENDIKNSDDMINGLTETEKDYMKIFKIIDNFASAKSELAALKRTVENYKLTDMTKELLDNKLSSSQIKLSILKKKIPDNFKTLDSLEMTSVSTRETMRKAILEYSPELSPSEIDKTVKKSLQLIEEENLQIKSKLGVFQATYLDGAREDMSIIEHSLISELEKNKNSRFILRLPSGSLDLSSLSIKNIDYTPEQEGLVSFETDTKGITYTLNQKLDTQILKEISVSLIISQEESIPLTGYFLSNVPTEGPTFATFLILVLSGLMGYLFFIKQQQKKAVSLEFLGKAKQVKDLQKEGKTSKANALYDQLKIEYLSLSKDQKHEVFKKIKHLSSPS
jgi:hypothetical protein